MTRKRSLRIMTGCFSLSKQRQEWIIMSNDKAPFSWEDPFQIREQFSEEERLILESARNYAQDKLLPRVQSAFRE